jgi:hypothetical protein
LASTTNVPAAEARKISARKGGSVLLAVIVVLVIGGLLFFLYHRRETIQKEGREFALQVIQRCAFQHDVKYLHSVVAEDRRLAIPPGKDDEFIETLARLGAPSPNNAISGKLQFDDYFFSPHGTYKSVLLFPDRAGTFYVNVALPSAMWVVTDYGIIWERPPD